LLKRLGLAASNCSAARANIISIEPRFSPFLKHYLVLEEWNLNFGRVESS
jgi:hypothetical protein